MCFQFNRFSILITAAAFILISLPGCFSAFDIKFISTEKAPAAIGPYSQAVLANNVLYISGQIPLSPETGVLVDGGIEVQTHRVMKNIIAILEAAEFSIRDLVQCHIYLANLEDYQIMNNIYASYFYDNFPSRVVVEVSKIPRGALIEISAVAVKRR